MFFFIFLRFVLIVTLLCYYFTVFLYIIFTDLELPLKKVLIPYYLWVKLISNKPSNKSSNKNEHNNQTSDPN